MGDILKRYWFEFELPKPRLGHNRYIPIGGGCGVTAFDYDDALKIIHSFFLQDNETAIFSRIVENVDISTIEDENVQRNMGVSVWRGVWYPAYNLWQGAYTEK